MRLILAGAGARASSRAAIGRPDRAQSVTFRPRRGAKLVARLAGRTCAGLRLHGKGANRTRPTRCPAFSRAAATGPPPPPRDFGPGLQPWAEDLASRRRGLKK